jgi:hypothetical protein
MIKSLKTIILSFCFCVVASLYAFGQTGFYLIVDNKDLCVHTVMSIDEKQKFCITDEPIIKESEFKTVGALQYDFLKENQFFNLQFSESGLETLKLINEHLPNRRLVFVVKGKEVGIYRGKNLKPTEYMPIRDKVNSPDIKWVYDNLKAKTD